MWFKVDLNHIKLWAYLAHQFCIAFAICRKSVERMLTSLFNEICKEYKCPQQMGLPRTFEAYEHGWIRSMIMYVYDSFSSQWMGLFQAFGTFHGWIRSMHCVYFLNDLNECVVGSLRTYNPRWIRARICIYFEQMESISPYFHYHKIYVQGMDMIG
jgi:hypothetical protein